MGFGEKLKKARQNAGLSQKEMADKLGINPRTYGSYERDERDVSTSLLLNICNSLKISSDELLETDIIKETVAPYKTPRVTVKTDGVQAYKLSSASAAEKPYVAEVPTKTDKEIEVRLAVLNDMGKDKALDYITDLTEQEKYTKKG